MASKIGHIRRGNPLTNLILVFGLIGGFRLCFLRLCFWTVEESGLEEFENLLFILFCSAMVSGFIVLPLIFDRTRLSDSPAGIRFTLRVCAAGAIAAAVLSYITGGWVDLFFQFVTSFFVAGAVSVCLRRIADLGVAPQDAGRCIAFATALMAIPGAILFFLPFAEIPTDIILIVICVLPAVAAILFNAEQLHYRAETGPSVPLRNFDPFAKRLLRLAFLVLCLYVLAAGLLDNIYFFEAAFEMIPNFMFFILLYAMAISIIVGLAFERLDAAAAIILSFVLICLGQSMSFFSQNLLLVYPYTIFSNAGNNMMEIYLVALPIAYCILSRRKSRVIPVLGEILLYSSFLLTSVLFEFIPGSSYTYILGITLLISVAAILITFYLMNEGKNNQLRQLERFVYTLQSTENITPDAALLEAGFTQNEKDIALMLIEGRTRSDILRKLHLSAAEVGRHEKAIRQKILQMGDPDPVVSEAVEKYKLTRREAEILRLLLRGMTNPEIAADLFISETTVKFHVHNLLIKLGIESRHQLAAWAVKREEGG